VRMRAGNRKRFCTTLLVGAAALSLGCEVAKEASWKLRATVGGYSRGGSGVQSTDSRENRARRKAILQRPLIGGWNRSLQHVP
jgi:hypothetical protein